ncbi:MAG: hypothetical protein WC242_02305 [Candidatus Paceibacterota bacterium]|jgi:hypothetical protein
MKKKNFIIALTLLIITVGVFIAWFFWPKGESLNWGKYTNRELGYEVWYPREWELNSEGLNQIGLTKEDPSQEKVLITGIEDSYENSYYIIRIDVSTDSYLPEDNYKIVTLGGLEGRQWQEGAAPSSGPATITKVGKNSKFYSISYVAYAHEATHEKYMNIYNQILSTFRFTE